ncbi:hypothetical protein PO124_30030 [Bacillus licheniformis]|nr:hypothetical protein [Bacillus licheniformis]
MKKARSFPRSGQIWPYDPNAVQAQAEEIADMISKKAKINRKRGAERMIRLPAFHFHNAEIEYPVSGGTFAGPHLGWG